MKRREWAFLALCAAGYVVARGPAALIGPFILPFENAFQEAIALHHLGHLWDNRFLPVFARIDGVNFWHTAHPPLLHLFYAGLYAVLGTGEWVTRAAAIALYLASIALWRRTGADADRPGWPLYPLALFLPVPFILATTTNYEPLSIFFVSLIFYLGEALECGDSSPPFSSSSAPTPVDGVVCSDGRKKGGDKSPHSKVVCERLQSRALIPLLVALVPGLLTDWPVYLAVPALLVRHWREPGRRRLFLGLIAFEAVFLAALLGYMYWVAGEVALFGHAPQRANPVGLFSPALWRELGSHWLELSGAAATIIAATGVVAVAALTVFRRSFRGREFIPGLKTGTKVLATDSNAGNKFPATAFELFAIFTVILVLAAPQLVSRHYVYLLYFAPPVALALKDLVLRVDQKKLAVIALVLLFAAPNYIARYQRNPAYWAIAERVKDKGIKTAFASAAIGAWYYYAGIETVFPMSAAAAGWIEKNDPVLQDVDFFSPEVVSLKKEYLYLRPHYDFGWETVYFKWHGIIPDYLDLNNQFLLYRGKPVYCSCVRFSSPSSFQSRGQAYSTLTVKPAIIHSLPRVKSDGAFFFVIGNSSPYNDKWRGPLQLRYSRYVPDETDLPPVKIKHVSESDIDALTLPGPRDDRSFDDTWLIEPVLDSMIGMQP